MRRTLLAGFAYFGLVFTAGFVLGILRVLWLTPWLGNVGAVLLELPVILGISWVACGFLVKRFQVRARVPERLIMGLSALALVLLGEATISMVLADRSLVDHLLLYREAPHQLGLLGQLVFAAFPTLRLSGR